MSTFHQNQRGPLLSPRTPNKEALHCSIVRLQHELEDMYEGFSATLSSSAWDNNVDLGEQGVFSVSASVSSSDANTLPCSLPPVMPTDARTTQRFFSNSSIPTASSVWSRSSRALAYSRLGMVSSAHTSTFQATEARIGTTVESGVQPPARRPEPTGESPGDLHAYLSTAESLSSSTYKRVPSRTYRPSVFAFLTTQVSPAPPRGFAPSPTQPHTDAPGLPLATSSPAAPLPSAPPRTAPRHATAAYQGSPAPFPPSASSVSTRRSPPRRARSLSTGHPSTLVDHVPAAASPGTFTWNIDALSAPNVAPLTPATVLRAHVGSLYKLFSVYASARPDMHEQQAVVPLLPPHACLALLRHTGVVPHIASAAAVRAITDAITRSDSPDGTSPATTERLCVRVREEPMLTFDGYLRLLLLLTNLAFFRSRQVRALLPAPRAHVPTQVQMSGVDPVSIAVDLDVPVDYSSYAFALADSVVQLHTALRTLRRTQGEVAVLLTRLLRLCAEDPGETHSSRLARVEIPTAELEDLQRRLLNASPRAPIGYHAAAAATHPQEPFAVQLGAALAASLRTLGEAAGDELIIAPAWASLAVASLVEAADTVKEETESSAAGEAVQLCAAAVQQLSAVAAHTQAAPRAGVWPSQRPHTQWARARVCVSPSIPTSAGDKFACLFPKRPALSTVNNCRQAASPVNDAVSATAQLVERVLARPSSVRFSLLWSVAAVCLVSPNQPPSDAVQLLTPAQREGACAGLRARVWPLLSCTAAIGPTAAPTTPALPLPPPSTATARRLEVLLYIMHECQREQARVGTAQHYSSGPYAFLAHPVAETGPSADPAALAANAGVLLNFRGYLLQPMGETVRAAAVLGWSRRAAGLVIARQRVCAAAEHIRVCGALCHELLDLLQRATGDALGPDAQVGMRASPSKFLQQPSPRPTRHGAAAYIDATLPVT